MKRIRSAMLAALMLFALAACGTKNEPVTSSGSQGKTERTSDSDLTSETKVLVVYFSRIGEQYNVGTIDKGNTAIVAEMIAEKTGADLYEILPETDYPYTYNALTDIAKKEQSKKARPKIKGELPDVCQYDTVFIGAPVWWEDWPMICYTFFENVDLSGKKLVPFSTHEGSGLSGFDRKLSSAVPDATVLTGQAFRGNDCQKKQADVKKAVNKWIDGLGF